ncbi:MAG: TolC family protein [Acidobacteria bacterium]|nr:TolC family protein [Acidobacteriota bacterium]
MSVSAFGQSGQPSLSNALQAAARTTAMQPSTSVRRLSIDDATRLALEQNLGIRIQRGDPQIQDVGVWQARSFWAPNFTTSFNKNSNSQPAQSAILPSFQNGTLSSGVGLTEVLPWGGSYSANWNNQRLTSTNILNNFSPQLQSALNVNYTQPLLRNFSFDQIRQQVQNSKKVRDLSDIQLRGVVTGTMRNVKNAYWDLVYAINNLKAQQQSLALSQQSLKDNQKRVQIGTMAPIDIVQAQAEVASNDQGVIIADANIKQAQDNLRALILDPGTPDFWTVEFEPTDEPAFSEQPIDVDEAVRNALSKRSDLMSAKNSLEQSDVNIKYYKNQVLPDVNASVNYGTFGVGGTQLTPVDLALAASGLAPNRAILAQRGYGTVLGDVFGSAYPQWSVGVQFGYPIGASTAQANLARVKLQYEEAQMQMKNVELQITTQVRAVARNVQTNQKRVQSARASRELQEKKLEAEEKKLAAGMSSTFFVFQAQRDLSIARVVEIQAIADYNKSLVDFQAVQEVPVGGGFGGITTAGTGAISTGGSLIIRQ